MNDTCIFPLCTRKVERNEFCFLHAKHFAGAKIKALPKPIAKESAKKKEEKKADKPVKDEQAEWFAKKVSELTGKCMECGGPTKNPIYVYAKACIAHVLPKRKGMFPSVATHPDNSLELCATNGCHSKYDNSWDDATKMKIWPIVVAKFKKIYPSIAPGERKHIPDVLLQEVEPV